MKATFRKRNPGPQEKQSPASRARLPRPILFAFRFPVSALLLLSAFHFAISDSQAAPMAYSGKLTVWGFAHDGPGHFRFQLRDTQGNVLWNNDPDGGAVTL